MSTKTLTTGVINKTFDTGAAHSELLNLSNSPRTVTVQVYDWDGAQLSNQTLTINPNDHMFADTDIPANTIHYEVRYIIQGRSKGLIINTFAATNVGQNLTVANNTVLHHQLVKVDYDDDDDDDD